MDKIAYELKTLTLGSGEGSHLTRNQRHRGLQLAARELAALGYRLPSAGSLKPKHIQALVGSWKASGLSTGTLKNRMSWVRWWACKDAKPLMLFYKPCWLLAAGCCLAPKAKEPRVGALGPRLPVQQHGMGCILEAPQS